MGSVSHRTKASVLTSGLTCKEGTDKRRGIEIAIYGRLPLRSEMKQGPDVTRQGSAPSAPDTVSCRVRGPWLRNDQTKRCSVETPSPRCGHVRAVSGPTLRHLSPGAWLLVTELLLFPAKPRLTNPLVARHSQSSSLTWGSTTPFRRSAAHAWPEDEDRPCRPLLYSGSEKE